MRFILLIAFIAFANAQEYREALKAGQRRFTSEGLKQGVPGLKYDIKFVERFHSLDHGDEVFSILCAEESVLIHANTQLDWRAGDVFAGDERWQCGAGFSRVVLEITFRKMVNNKYEYLVKTRQAELEEIFEYADITFENQETEDEFIQRAKIAATDLRVSDSQLKSAAGEFSKTFTMVDKSITLISNQYLTSKITAKVDIPLYFGGFQLKIKWPLRKSYFATSASIGAIVEFKWETTFKYAYEKDFRKDLFKFSKFTIPLCVGPITLTFSFTPTIFVGCEVKFNLDAKLVLEYKKHVTAGFTLDTRNSPKFSKYYRDETEGAKPTLTGEGSISGNLSPYVGAGITIGAGFWGIDIIKGTPSLIFKLQGTLTNLKFTLQPKLLFGFTLKIIVWDVCDAEKVLWSGPTWTLDFTFKERQYGDKPPSSSTGGSGGGSGGGVSLPNDGFHDGLNTGLEDRLQHTEHFRYAVDDMAAVRR